MEISFVIISRDEESLKKTLERLKQIISEEKINAEIIISTGESPSRQRNEAAKISQGEWLYFLDNDSYLDRQSIDQFKIAKRKFPKALVFGGPSLQRYRTANRLQEAIELVFTSDLGVGPVKSRYISIGVVRRSDEKEMILCNMIVLRSYFLQTGGFREELFPNEENEFLSRTEQVGQIIYSPLIVVYRYHRKSVAAFMRQMIHYGKGRTRHFLYSSSYTDYVYFSPLVAICVLIFGILYTLSFKVVLYILCIYLIIILPTCFVNFLYKRSIISFVLSIVTFLICHLGYSFGLFLGFFNKSTKPNIDITVRVI